MAAVLQLDEFRMRYIGAVTGNFISIYQSVSISTDKEHGALDGGSVTYMGNRAGFGDIRF